MTPYYQNISLFILVPFLFHAIKRTSQFMYPKNTVHKRFSRQRNQYTTVFKIHLRCTECELVLLFYVSFWMSQRSEYHEWKYWKILMSLCTTCDWSSIGTSCSGLLFLREDFLLTLENRFEGVSVLIANIYGDIVSTSDTLIDSDSLRTGIKLIPITKRRYLEMSWH